MPRLLEPIWLTILSFSENQLAETIEYLREENRILRGKLPDRITVTPQERSRLVKLGSKLGPAIRDIITIVSPRTFARWVQRESSPHAPKTASTRSPGRPPTDTEIRELILTLARETGWGYTRILGELKKLKISVSRSTVVNILKAEGIDPSPKRSEGTWAEFLRRHVETLWACDFLSVKTLTARGLVEFSVLFFIHPGTRKVIIGGISTNPDAAWMQQQARNVTLCMEEFGLPVGQLVRDRDGKFAPAFDAIFESEGATIVKTCVQAPNMNAFAERFAQTLRHELLDHFVICGEQHLRYLLSEFAKHYHAERPHQGLDNVCIDEPTDEDDSPSVLAFPSGGVECHERLGGLLKHYTRLAA